MSNFTIEGLYKDWDFSDSVESYADVDEIGEWASEAPTKKTKKNKKDKDNSPKDVNLNLNINSTKEKRGTAKTIGAAIGGLGLLAAGKSILDGTGSKLAKRVIHDVKSKVNEWV